MRNKGPRSGATDLLTVSAKRPFLVSREDSTQTQKRVFTESGGGSVDHNRDSHRTKPRSPARPSRLPSTDKGRRRKMLLHMVMPDALVLGLSRRGGHRSGARGWTAAQ